MVTAPAIVVAGGLALATAPLYAQVAEEVKLIQPGGYENFRYSALDGDVALLSNPDPFGSTPAHVDVYRRDVTGSWVKEAELTNIGAGPQDAFGWGVELKGNRAVVVGHEKHATGGADSTGFVFDYQPGVGWVQTGELPEHSSAVTYIDNVALDGDRVLLAAPYQQTKTGFVDVYERDSSGAWAWTAQLKASDGATYDEFGSDMAISGDRVLVGAKAHDLPGEANAGAAYVFEREPGGTWNQVAELVASQASNIDYFGTSVDLDGDRAVVGAPQDAGRFDQSGAVYVFERQSGGAWLETARLVPSAAQSYGNFGLDVALDGDLIAPASWETDDHGKDTGAFWVFHHGSDGLWTELDKVVASDKVWTQWFAFRVVLSGHRALATDKLSNPAGYIYELTPLSSSITEISVSRGGSQPLALEAGHVHANRPYLLLGSASGTEPGLPAGDFVLPLAPDAYLHLTLAHPDAAPFIGGVGILNSNGGAQASVELPGGLPPMLAGLTLNHAFEVFDESSQVEFVSQALPLTLVP